MSTAPNPFEQLARPLVNGAKALAIAHGERRMRSLRGDGSAWRKPGLLWPTFSKRTR